MIDWSKLLSLKFWFKLNPGPMSEIFLKFFTAVFICALLLMVVFKILYLLKSKKDKIEATFYKKFYHLWLASSLTGFLILFFFYEEAYFLSARFWFLAWLIMIVIWLFFIIKYKLKVIPERKAQAEEKRRIKKYLPK